jgi:hypothetical protein
MTQFEPVQQQQIIGSELAFISEAQFLPPETSYTLVAGSRHADFGTDGILAWGRWIDGVSLFGTLENYNGNTGLHYVVGLPTATMPTTGTATYTLLGATRPTLIDGSATPGTFSGSLSVDFGSASVGMNLNVAVGTFGYSINGSASISSSTFSGSFFQGEGLTPTTPSSCSCGCSANVQGFFAGANAERAGLGYHITDFSSPDIVGAAAFIKQ